MKESRNGRTYSQVDYAVVETGVQKHPFELNVFCRVNLGIGTCRILYAERQYGVKAGLKVDLDRQCSAFVYVP